MWTARIFAGIVFAGVIFLLWFLVAVVARTAIFAPAGSEWLRSRG